MFSRGARLIVIALGIAGGAGAQPARTPQQVADELLAADRAFAARGATMPVTDALMAMFAADVVLPTPAGVFARGRDAALAALRSNADNVTGRMAWAPIRAGVSADGQHGFTYGYATVTRGDSFTMPLKYLSYWVKKPEGWRVVLYRRGRRPEGTVSTVMLPAVLPARALPVHTDGAAVARVAAELGDVERAFSAEAGRVGLSKAFTRNADPDAMNMGGPNNASFLFGPEAIGGNFGPDGAKPATITWGPDEGVLVASSGDLGVTMGYIVIPANTPGVAPSRVPFFTVWRRVSPTAPWRFIAE
jgi:ketosteroid isomerase-like protein